MRKRGVLLTFVIIICAFLTGCVQTAKIQAVNVVAVKIKKPPSIGDHVFTGTLKPSYEAEIFPNISGKVAEILVKLGQKVEKDQPLFQLDTAGFSSQLKQAQATYNAAVIGYENASGGEAKQAETQQRQTVEKAQKDLEDAQASYDTAKAAFDNQTDITPLLLAYNEAKENYDNEIQKSQAESELYIISDGEETQTDMNLESAKTKLDDAEAQLEAMKNTVKTTMNVAYERLSRAKTAVSVAKENLNTTLNRINPEKIKNAKAQMERTKVAVEAAQKKVEDAQVKAPMAGFISQIQIHQGDRVSQQDLAMKIMDINTMQVTIQMTETEVEKVIVGMEANVSIQRTGETMKAAVSEILPAEDTVSRLFDVTIKLENEQGILKDGMDVSIHLIPETEEAFLLVPEQSVITKEQTQFIFLLKEGKAAKREVEIGTVKNGYLEVKGDIRIDDLVIAQGMKGLEDGTRVHLIEHN